MITNRDIQQGSLEWFDLRCGVVTASEADSLITPAKLQPVSESAATSYLALKLAEKVAGPQSTGRPDAGGEHPLRGPCSWDMEQGQILEEEARPAFSIETGIQTGKVGFLTTDDGRLGCSPDAVIEEGGNIVGGVEIKCPSLKVHIARLLNPVLPREYLLQVQFSMLVTGAEYWWFFCYRRRMDPICLKVERDPHIIMALQNAANAFIADMDDAWTRLRLVNRRIVPTQPKQSDLSDQNDIPT